MNETTMLELIKISGGTVYDPANGIDAQQAAAAWNDPTWKARLKHANDEALAAGVFGAPFFMVDGEPFWGNDRKAQIERWLAQGPF